MQRVVTATIVVAFAAATAAPARAEPTGNTWMVDFSPTIGVDHISGAGTALAIGWHPELSYGIGHQDEEGNFHGIGLGIYGALTTASHDSRASWASAGVQVIGYLHTLRSVELSFGVNEGDGHGARVEAGAFAGWRLVVDHLDMPVGLRLDLRPGGDDVPTSFAVQAQIDVLPLLIVLYWISHSDWHTD